MGVNFSHDGPQWDHIGFGRFRKELARHEGIDLDRMEGFKPMFVSYERWHPISWNAVDTPLKPLLDHDDHDGELTPDECRTVAPRLREVVKEMWPLGYAFGTDRRTRQRALALADAMDRAAASGEPLEFD